MVQRLPGEDRPAPPSERAVTVCRSMALLGGCRRRVPRRKAWLYQRPPRALKRQSGAGRRKPCGYGRRGTGGYPARKYGPGAGARAVPDRMAFGERGRLSLGRPRRVLARQDDCEAADLVAEGHIDGDIPFPSESRRQAVEPFTGQQPDDPACVDLLPLTRTLRTLDRAFRDGTNLFCSALADLGSCIDRAGCCGRGSLPGVNAEFPLRHYDAAGHSFLPTPVSCPPEEETRTNRALPVAADECGRIPLGGEHDSFRPGDRVDEYGILEKLGVGGFGEVYLARQHQRPPRLTRHGDSGCRAVDHVSSATDRPPSSTASPARR